MKKTIKLNFLARVATLLLLSLLTTVTAWATVTWDGGSGTTGDPYYVNMPKDIKTIDVSDGSVTTFMVYDDGGPDAGYSANYGGALIITAPTGYKINVAGSINTEEVFDYLAFYNGNDYPSAMGTKLLEESGEKSISTTSETGSMIIDFLSDESNTSDGFALTVTIEAISGSHAINIADCAGGCTLTASPATADAGQTVTLTSSPAAGYVLGALSVRDADGKVVDVSGDMLWYIDANTNTATFTMPNGDVTVTPVFTNVMTADGGLTVNMPKEWAKRVTIPSGVTSFKVYDYGGADANYLGENGQHLYLTAPDNCVLQLEGTVTTKAGGATTFSVYDGEDGDADYLVNNVCSTTDGTAVTIPAVVSSGESIHLSFNTDTGDDFAGLDLTVTVISPGDAYAVTVSNADDKKGTMTADVATAQLGTTVTLTAEPDEGCVLSDLSVTCGGRAVKVDWNVWTNSATFRMPNGAVTVTPTFTSDLTSLAVCLPVKGNKNVTIPEGVASFKIYDDGGPDGNYTPYCIGNVIMTAAEGSQLRITGSVTGPEDKFNMTIDNTTFSATSTGIDVTSTASKPHIGLQTSWGDTGAGLDLTATVLYAVNVPNSIANGTVTPSVANAAADETVTLTVTPDADCTIGSVSAGGQPLEAVGGVYSFTMPARRVTVGATFRKLLSHADIAVADIPAQKYNGTAQTPAITVTDGTTELTKGTDYTISPETATDAGDYTVTITGIGQYDGTATRTFTISRRAVTLTSATESRAYDGTPLTADGVTVSGDGFAEGEGATYSVTGTQTGAGSSANTFTYTLNDGTKAANYDITKQEGTLTVTPMTGITVTITGHTESTPYDGKEHTISGYDVEISSPLYTENDFTFSGTATASQTDAGTTAMGLAAGQFENINPNFDGVTFSVTDGSMTIMPRMVNVPMAAIGLVYTGREQTGVAGGEGYTVTDGTATAAGNHTATATLNDANNYQWSDLTTETKEIVWSIAYYAASLADDGNNATVLASIIDNYGGMADVTLTGRTLYKDGDWNTLCLPFDVPAAQMAETTHPLFGAVIMELDVDGNYSGKQTGFDATDGTLYLYFKEATTIEAGKPYIVKWNSGDNLDSPVFSGVTVSTDAPTGVTLTDGKYIVSAQNSGLNTVQFIGTYSPVTLTPRDKSNLFLGTSTDDQNQTVSTLYYPDAANNDDGYYHINACRAFFHVDLTGTPNGVRAFSLNFGNGSETESQGISDALRLNDKGEMINDKEAGAWYDLQGRRVASVEANSSKATGRRDSGNLFPIHSSLKKGLYIHGGKKVVVK